MSWTHESENERSAPSDNQAFETDSLKSIGVSIERLRRDVDEIVPPLVAALKQNRYFDELQGQLRTAERLAQAWRDWPLIVGIHEAILSIRGGQANDRYLLEHLENLLFQVGVEEYGLVGEVVEAQTVEITAFEGAGHELTVSVCNRPGLRQGPAPLRKAIVEVTRSEKER